MAGASADNGGGIRPAGAEIDTRLVDTEEFARLSGTSVQDVQDALACGALIKLASKFPGGRVESGIPAFLAIKELSGAPLERLFAVFRDPEDGQSGAVDGPQAYQFLVAQNNLLGNFTPIEVLTGIANIDPADKEAAEFFAKPKSERFEFVFSLAGATEAAKRSW